MRVGLVIGTRPEAIKMAPVVRELRARAASGLESIVIATGQHQDLVWPILDFFEIRPDHELKSVRKGRSLNLLFANIIAELDSLLPKLNLDLLLVQGDTTSAAAAAHAAFHRRIKVAHVEAGLRTGRLDAPWPEEWYRRTIALSSSFHFAPTRSARNNLLREGFPAESILVTGNTVIDALLSATARLKADRSLMAALDAKFACLDAAENIVLVTLHRRENFGQGIRGVCRALTTLAQPSGVSIVLPVHPNPNVQEQVRGALEGRKNIHLIPPAGYVEFVYLMNRCRLILTDSGGVQEEAPSLGKPVLVLRNSTERREGVSAGAAELVGTDPDRIVTAARSILERHERSPPQRLTNPFGDGRAAERIAEFIASANWMASAGMRGERMPSVPIAMGKGTRPQRVPLQLLARRSLRPEARVEGFRVGSGEGAGRA